MSYLYSFSLINHGGFCCGIKTIYGFPCYPDDIVPGRKEKPINENDRYGYAPSVTKPFFTDKAPREKAIDRLDRYISFVRARRPSHIIEAVLNSMQINHWGKHLIERGFTLSVKHKNSNTGNTVYVYHLTIG